MSDGLFEDLHTVLNSQQKSLIIWFNIITSVPFTNINYDFKNTYTNMFSVLAIQKYFLESRISDGTKLIFWDRLFCQTT